MFGLKCFTLFQSLKNVFFIHQAFCFGKTMNKPFTIIVEGNIGSGKTTFINHFKNNKNILTLSEPINEWKDLQGHNLLNLMYNDTAEWAFIFQTYVQLTMTKLHETKTEKSVKMLERSLYSARFCFVENFYQNGLLPHTQLVVLDEWFKWLIKRNNMACDLIIYLRTSPNIAYERIKCRNRKEEKNISMDLIEKLHECHENWLYLKTKFYCPARVLILNADKDVETIHEEYKTFKNEINL